MIGFCGSRSLPGAYARVVSLLVAALAPGSAAVAVGDAPGADALVRSACPSALIFRAASFSAGALVARSCAMVAAVASSPSPVLVGFVEMSCPAGIAPGTSWRSGRPVSGSWSSLALAAGRGVRVGVVLCAPLLSPPTDWGDWSREIVAGVPVWWLDVDVQMGLFS